MKGFVKSALVCAKEWPGAKTCEGKSDRRQVRHFAHDCLFSSKPASFDPSLGLYIKSTACQLFFLLLRGTCTTASERLQ